MALNFIANALAGGGGVVNLDPTTGAITITPASGQTTTITGLAVASPSFSGDLTISTAASRVVPGATSFAVRDHANTRNNFLIADSGAITSVAQAGSGSGVAGSGYSFSTGASGGGTAAGGDLTIALGSETGVAKAGRTILNRTSVQTDGGSYNGALTINETLTPATTVTGSTQALNILYTMNGAASAYTSAGGNAGIGPIESQFICNLTGTLATLLYGAEFQFIHQGTGSANAVVVQADLYGLAPSPGTLSAGVNFRAVIGPLNGITATVVNGVDVESGGFATRNGITANSMLSVRNYYAGCYLGSSGATDTTGAYAITGYAGVIPTQGGNTSGTNTNFGINISHLFPNSGGGTPGVNGNADNYAAQLGVPNAVGPGSGTGRVHNIGLFITGNGAASTQGAGFTNDWAFHSISTAPSGMLGALYIGAPSTNNPPQTSAMLTILGTKTIVSGAGAVLNTLSMTAATITLSGGSNVTTATGFNLATLVAPTLSNASISVLRSSTLAITGAPAASGGMSITNAFAFDVQAGNIALGAGVNFVLDTATGTQIGTGTTQKLGFYGSTAIVQPAASADVTGFAAGVGTASKSDSTWTGASGAAAYTVGGIVTRLKALGLLAS